MGVIERPLKDPGARGLWLVSSVVVYLACMGRYKGYPARCRSIWLLGPLALIILALVITSCGSEGQASLEERAHSINRSLICPVCPGETIDQAQVELARQMRAVVREKLADGWTRERILQFFVDRYGESVLAAPPKSGFNLVAWVVPFAAVGVAAVLLFFVVRSMRRSGTARQEYAPPSIAPELEPYLSRVDRELGIFRQAGSEQALRQSSGHAQEGSEDPEKQGGSSR